MNQNAKAFLTMIAVSEGTAGKGDDGYNVIVGGRLFADYSDHPREAVWIRRIKKYSTAAGRYQILARYFDAYRRILHLSDFSPQSQDAIAIRMIRECGAIADIKAGRFESAVKKCSTRWASLPGAGYGQREAEIGDLRIAYLKAGGRVA